MPGLSSSRSLLITIRDTTLAEVVRRKLDGDPISLQDLDEIHPHLAGDVGEDLMSVLKLDPEHCVRQCLLDHAIHFDRPLFRHL